MNNYNQKNNNYTFSNTSYIDKMNCYYSGICKQNNHNLCNMCGKCKFSPINKNIYTNSIPRKEDYSYVEWPRYDQKIWYYGSKTIPQIKNCSKPYKLSRYNL